MSSNPVYDYLNEAIERLDIQGTPEVDHQTFVNGILQFLREDMQYVVKFGDERLLREIAERLEDYA
jgi:hypothetical protein